MGPGGCETNVLEAAFHGIQEGVYIPMFLMDLSRCETCVIMTPCFNPGGLDALEALDPGLASRAQAVGMTGLESATSAMWAPRRVCSPRTNRAILYRNLNPYSASTDLGNSKRTVLRGSTT